MIRVLAAGIVTGTYTDTRHIIQTRTNPIPAEGTCANDFDWIPGHTKGSFYRSCLVSRESDRLTAVPKVLREGQSTLSTDVIPTRIRVLSQIALPRVRCCGWLEKGRRAGSSVK